MAKNDRDHDSNSAKPPARGGRPVHDHELVARCLARDDLAWAELERRYRAVLRRTIGAVARNFPRLLTVSDIDDVYAMVLARLFVHDMRALRAYDPAREVSLGTWLATVTRNVAYDWVRSARRHDKLEPHDDTFPLPCPASLQEAVEARESLRHVAHGLATLTERDRSLVSLCYADGLAAHEVAASMAISVKTVHSKLHKVRCKLEVAVRRRSARPMRSPAPREASG